MNAINELKEAKRLQRTLKANPNDIDSLLKLAATLKDLDLKRKVLNRILSLDPINKTARDMVLVMDRAEMGGDHSQTALAGISEVQHSAPVSLNDPLEEPVVFRYSIIHQILVFGLMAFTVAIGLKALQSGGGEVLFVISAFFLFLIIRLWFVSVVAQISSSGIKISRLFGIARWEIPWGEIEKIESNAVGQGIKLITRERKLVEVPSQLHGYPAIVEILRQMRPDLFSIAGSAAPGDALAMTGTKTFQKS